MIRRFMFLVLLCPSFAWAQAASTARPAAPVWEIEPYIGIAKTSPAGTHLGMTPGRDHLFVGVHITAVLLDSRLLTFAYAPEFVPVLLLSSTPTYHTEEFFVPQINRTLRQLVIDGESTVAGFGVSPVGFEGRLRAGSRVRLYAATAAGFVMFSRDTPVPGARRFHYTFEFGGGAEFLVRRGWWVRAGYKLHHFSNGNATQENLGVDGMVVMIGISRAIGRR